MAKGIRLVNVTLLGDARPYYVCSILVMASDLLVVASIVPARQLPALAGSRFAT